MVNYMRYLTLLFLIIFSSFVFSQEDESPASCTGGLSGTAWCSANVSKTCPTGYQPFKLNVCASGQTQGVYLQCKGGCVCYDGKQMIDGVCKCPANTHWESYPAGGGSCVPDQCPAGQIPNTIVTSQGSITTCIDDPDSDNPPECEPPLVDFAGLCRMPESTPDQCGDTYTTANSVQGGYVCSNDENCGDGSSPTIYTTANGSWKVCGNPDNNPSSSDSNSSPPSSSPSNGGDSSTGSGDGSGGGSGDGSGNGTGSGSGSSSGGQSSSSSGTPTGNPPTQSTSSTSSGAHGWGSSGSAAGNCDPTSYDYLDCISRENPGEGGDGIDDINQSGYEMDIQQRLQQARDKYTNKITQIKQDFESEVSLSLSTGGGSLPTKSVNLYGENVDLGIASRSDFFDLIKWLFLAVASVVSVYILFAPR